MSIALAMVLFGALLLYAGWGHLSVTALLRGDNTAKTLPGESEKK